MTFNSRAIGPSFDIVSKYLYIEAPRIGIHILLGCHIIGIGRHAAVVVTADAVHVRC